jgi:catechol 2,3-dioxygenase-like lactoylglutathione lyase family enzyme
MAVVVETLVNIVVPVQDVARARQFYGTVLGLAEIERPESVGSPGAWLRAGTVVIQLAGREQAGGTTKHRFGLWVENVEAARRAFGAAGVMVRKGEPKSPGIQCFLVCDPDGNEIEIQGSDGTSFAA